MNSGASCREMGKGEQTGEGEVRRRPKPKPKQKQKDDGEEKGGASQFKYYVLVALFMFPAVSTLISVSGDFLANFGAVFGSISKSLIILPILLLPVLLSVYVKKFRGFLKILLPGLIIALVFPTLQVYLCSPIELRNEDIGTRFSLKTTASELLENICQEECLDKSKIPSSYALTMFTARVAITARFGHIVELNLTTTTMVGGQQVKLAKVVLLRSWRSVRGKLHPIYVITRVPVRLKKFDASLQAKKGLILTGRIANVAKELADLRSKLEGQRHYFVRPFVLEVFRVVPVEDESKDE